MSIKHNAPKSGLGSSWRRGRALLVAAVAASTLTGWLVAGGLDDFALGGGGDTVGSLPQMAPPPPSELSSYGDNVALWGPATPSFGLSGRMDAILACLVDAYPTGPDGSYRFVDLGEGRVRLEFIGRVNVVLDRAAFHQAAVRSEVVVGSTFTGGLANTYVDDVLRTSSVLTPGVLDLKLRALDNAGLLAQELLWHAANQQGKHRVLEIKSVGNTIRIEQRD